MPRQPVNHLNSPDNDNKTMCGRLLRKVRWTIDPVDVTCNNCQRVYRRKP